MKRGKDVSSGSRPLRFITRVRTCAALEITCCSCTGARYPTGMTATSGACRSLRHFRGGATSSHCWAPSVCVVKSPRVRRRISLPLAIIATPCRKASHARSYLSVPRVSTNDVAAAIVVFERTGALEIRLPASSNCLSRPRCIRLLKDATITGIGNPGCAAD